MTIGKSQFLMGKSTISMAMFNSFLYVYQAGKTRKSDKDWDRNPLGWSIHITNVNKLTNSPMSHQSVSTSSIFKSQVHTLTCFLK